MTTNAYALTDTGRPLERIEIHRRELRPDDVDIRVQFCGVCHSDLHAIHGAAALPLVPGHEFSGEVVRVGSAVDGLAPGDQVVVGNIVDSCGRCAMCERGQENYCVEFPTLTYGGADRHDGSRTQGAYAGRYVAARRFVYRRPESLDAAAVAPLMCAGITVWEPLRSAGVGPGTRLGVVGLGGLGHLAVRFGVALGAEVTVFSTTPAKAEDAQRLGAHAVVISTDDDAMTRARGTLDVVIDTVAADHELAPYLGALDLDGMLFTIGHLGSITVQAMDLLVGRKRLASSGSGGRRGTQEMLDFSAEHGIVADVEVVPHTELTTALDRLSRNDVRYRFVLDLRGIDG